MKFNYGAGPDCPLTNKPAPNRLTEPKYILVRNGHCQHCTRHDECLVAGVFSTREAGASMPQPDDCPHRPAESL